MLLRRVLKAINSLRKEFGIQTEPDLASILRLPGVIGAAAASLDGEIERLGTVVERCLGEALEKLDRMREQEAGHLRDEMSARLRHIAALTAQLEETIAEGARPRFRAPPPARLQELLGEAPLDPARLAQEASIAAERSDVSEELARLRSHVQQFESLLAERFRRPGKKLDFLLREMQRRIEHPAFENAR